MEFRQIQYFICLFEEGSVTRAARRVHVVQPALSVQIAKLEEELGQPLFTRSPRGMEPTDAAHRMYQLYLPLMRDFAHAREQMLCRDGEITGQVTIGMITSLAEGVLSETLTEFARMYPKVRVSVSNGRLLEWVSTGQIDAAIVDMPRQPLTLNVEAIGDEDMVLMGPPDGTPAWSPIAFVDLAALPLVTTTRQHVLRRILDDYAQSLKLTITPAVEVDSIITTVKLIAATGMYAVLPRSAASNRLADRAVHVRRIVDPTPVRQIGCVTHPRRPINTATSLFIEMLASHMRARPSAGEPPPGDPSNDPDITDRYTADHN
ncbi:LysR family transcriptional regulator [Pigmentiphaga litoralis]|uniref:LysR family transcriptional regulator n=1 Tax=Pigmentiphaga litoralis TaxID=516702 RepID=UPI003B427EA1